MIEIILLIIFIIFIILSTIILFVLNLKKPELEMGSILVVFDSNRTNHRVIGTIVNEIDNLDGNRVIIKFKPKDIDIEKAKKNEVQTLITPKSHVLTFPRGSWSADREMVLVLPFNVDKFSKHFDNENLKNLFSFTAESSASNIRLQSMKEKISRMNTFIQDYAEGEFSALEFHKFKEMVEEIYKMSTEKKPASPFKPTY